MGGCLVDLTALTPFLAQLPAAASSYFRVSQMPSHEKKDHIPKFDTKRAESSISTRGKAKTFQSTLNLTQTDRNDSKCPEYVL